MSLTSKDIAEITRLLEDSSFDELELEIAGLKVHLRRGGATHADAAPDGGAADAASMPPGVPVSAAPAVGNPRLVELRAPLLGTFYRASKPGAPPFVEPGADVEPESIVGIIEVMKLMNAVRAGARGVVREIHARDGALVEYGELLLRIDPRTPG